MYVFDMLSQSPLLSKVGIADLKLQGNEHQPSSTDNFVVPFEQNRSFTGREKFLEKLKENMYDQSPKKYNHRVALYGMGGIGKTQTALQYVYTNRDCYERIYWITAVNQASLLSGFQKIATKAGLNSLLNLKPGEIAEAVFQKNRTMTPVLSVVFILAKS